MAAILFGLLAISNFLKPVFASAHTGFVFLGQRLSGLPNDILGPMFGVILAVYAFAIWRMRRFALPLGWVYASYVVANGILFAVSSTDKPLSPVVGIATFAIGAGIPIAAAVILTARRGDLK